MRGYGNRMDTMWALRSAYTEAMKIKLSQDEYCAKAEAGLWEGMNGPFPEDIKWEMLVDVLRGKVKVLPIAGLSTTVFNFCSCPDIYALL